MYFYRKRELTKLKRISKNNLPERITNIILKYSTIDPLFLREPILQWSINNLEDYFLLNGVHYKILDVLYSNLLVEDLSASEIEYDVGRLVNVLFSDVLCLLKDVQNEQQEKYNCVQNRIRAIQSKMKETKRVAETENIKAKQKELECDLSKLQKMARLDFEPINNRHIATFETVFKHTRGLVLERMDEIN